MGIDVSSEQVVAALAIFGWLFVLVELIALYAIRSFIRGAKS